MVIGIIGESCTGKSFLAAQLKDIFHAQVYTGRDYLRLSAGNEAAAQNLFCKKLQEAVEGSTIIYVISEKEHLALLPDRAVRILVTADLDTIKNRFALRMRGALPAPVADMLERKHGCFDNEPHQIHIVSGQYELEKLCTEIRGIACR